jgi:hypothetical protein
VENQDVQAFVKKNSDVLLHYEFLLEPDPSTPDYEWLPVTLPRGNYKNLQAFVRSAESEPWQSTHAQPSGHKDSSNEVWINIKDFAGIESARMQVKLEVLMPELVAADTLCESKAGVMAGFTSFVDEDASSQSRLRIHLPEGLTTNDVIGYMDSDDKYMPILSYMEDDHPVIELKKSGKMSYYWVYTLFPSAVMNVPLKPDWRYVKDSEPRLIPRENIEFDAWIYENNVTKLNINYTAENIYSCLPVREITYWMNSRGSASAKLNGRSLNAKSRGRSTKTYIFQLDQPFIPAGKTETVEISANQHNSVYRIPEDPEYVTLSLTPHVFAAENPLPGSVWQVRIFLFPETDLRRVSPLDVPFTGTGKQNGRPFVYWKLNERKLVGVKFPRGPLKNVTGRFDFSRPRDWMAVVREVREVQIFLAILILVIAWNQWKLRGKRQSLKNRFE